MILADFFATRTRIRINEAKMMRIRIHITDLWGMYLCPLNISLIFMKKNAWYFYDFGLFLLKFSMVLADFLLPGSVSWNGSRSSWPKWNGSESATLYKRYMQRIISCLLQYLPFTPWPWAKSTIIHLRIGKPTQIFVWGFFLGKFRKYLWWLNWIKC